MPLTPSGKRILAKMTKKYGKDKGKTIFHSMIAEKKPGTSKWDTLQKEKRGG